MSKRALLFAAMAALISPGVSHAAVVMSPLTTFGTNGWLAPGSSAYLGILNNERGMTFGNGHVYLVSHAAVAGSSANIRILDGATGADLGGLNSSGITGGTFAVNNAAIGADGAIYVANLTVQSTTSPFKVYKWTSEASAPIVAYTGDAGLPGSRVGDDFAGIGSGSATRVAAGYNSTPVVAGNNGYSMIDPTAGTATAVAFTGTPPNAGDFRLGITFDGDSSHVYGTAGSSLYRYTTNSGSTGTLLGSPALPDPAGATALRLMAYAVVAGEPLLAVQSIGDSHVSLFDVTDPLHPVYITAGNNTTGTLTANGNGTGELAWDVHADGTATLYAMSTNQGIQAFNVVPEPASLGLLIIAAPLALRRTRRV